MTTYFSDTFAGSGSIIGHTPEVGFSGVVWADAFMGAMTLAGGNATSSSAVIGDTGDADYGANATNFGAPGTVTVGFSFTTGADVAPAANRVGMRLAVTVSAKETTVYLGNDGTNWGLALYGDPSLTPVTLAANTTYAGTLDIANGSQTLVFLGQTMTGALAYYDATGFSRIQLTVGDVSSIGSITVDGAVVVATGNAALSAPAPTAKGYSGAAAALSAPKPTLSFAASPDAAHATIALTAPSPTLFAHSGWRMSLAAPAPTLQATGHDSTGEKAASLTAPSPALSAYGGANAELTAPTGLLAITATSTIWGSAALSAPASTLAGTGTVASMAGANLSAPSPNLIGYGGAVCSITLTGSSTIQATGTTGAIGGAQITCPLFQLSASGTAQNHGSANLLAPSAQLGATAQAWLIAPGATLTAIGTATVTATYEAYAVNLNHNDPAANDEVTRYTNFPFTHIVRYQNSYYGVNSTGLYLLEGTTDGAEEIAWAFKTATTDFESPLQKTVVSAYFSGRLGAVATVTLTAGEGAGVAYSFATPRDAAAQNYRQKFGRGLKSRYYALGAAGAGALELDNIEFNTLNTTRRI